MAGVETSQKLQRSDTPMTNTTVIPLRQPDSIDDPLTEIAREGARRMLQGALRRRSTSLSHIRRRPACRWAPAHRATWSRTGTADPDRDWPGCGQAAEGPRSAVDMPAEAKIRFTSHILPKWARRRASMPCCRCFTCAVSPPATFRRRSVRCSAKRRRTCRPGDHPPHGRLEGGYDRWQSRDLSARRYVYIWADGVYLQARMERRRNACW